MTLKFNLCFITKYINILVHVFVLSDLQIYWLSQSLVRWLTMTVDPSSNPGAGEVVVVVDKVGIFLGILQFSHFYSTF